MQLPSQLTEDDVAPVIRDKILHYKQQTSVEGQFIDVEVKEEDTVEGFRYGATIVPFSGSVLFLLIKIESVVQLIDEWMLILNK